MADLLRPLYRLLRRHKIYKLALPDSSIRPGALVHPKTGEVLQHLTDLKGSSRTFFDPVGPVTLSEPVPADIVLDTFTQKVAVGGGVDVGIANLVSIRAGVEHSDSVTIEIKGLQKVFLQAGVDQVGKPALLEGGDYITLLNQNLKFMSMDVYLPLFKWRRTGWPAARAVDIAVALVYADSISFTFHTNTQADLEAELQVAVPVDVSMGVGVSHEGSSTVQWNCGLSMPIGYTASRYAWTGRKFSAAIF